jgi:transglutaminase-like putative cysteine protease
VSYRVRVEHISRYHYANDVHSSFNEARITPLTTPWQLVLESRVEVAPDAGLHSYVDYWGSLVHVFDIQRPHRDLTVTGRSVVETSPPGSPPPYAPGWIEAAPDAERTWEELHDQRLRDTFAEFLFPTRYVPPDPRIHSVAADLRSGHSPLDAAVEALGWVGDELTYVPGTTGVHTSAIEAWDGGAGVCQDFAHLTLAVLRSMGLPSRYCSGYVHPEHDADLGATVHGEGHAWIEVWTGDWHPFDPTEGKPTSEHHVLVARGRDYADVAPLKGIFHGGPTASLEVAVTLTRLA